MKRMSVLRILTLVLAIVMLFPLVACTTDDPSDDETSADNNDVTTAPTVEVTTSNEKADPLPADLKYNDKKVKVLYWSDVEHQEFFIEDQTGDIVTNAIFDRNHRVEARLGIELEWEGQVGNSDNRSSFVKRMETIHADNDNFTCFATYSLTAADAAVKGYCHNLLSDETAYLNFNDETYWPSRLITEVTFGDNLYFCSGDISANALYMMYVCYVNTDILADHGLQNPQELVEDGNWTYSRFIKDCENVYEDMDDIEGKSDGDKYGYMSSGIHNDVWFYGTGAVIAEYSADNVLQVSPSAESQEVIDAFEKIHRLFYTSNDGYYCASPGTFQKGFGEGRILFITDRCRTTFKTIAANNYSVKYCIVPCPKYNAKQESYVTVMGNPFTLYGIFSSAPEENRSVGAAFLEYYAYESYRVVTPAVFELSLKAKYVQDDISARMYDIVRENLTFDIGRIFSTDVLNLSGGQNLFRNIFKVANTPTWASTFGRQKQNINGQLAKLQETLDK